jgi:hypothetical protein
MYFAEYLLLETVLKFVYNYTLGNTFVKTVFMAVVDTFLALLICVKNICVCMLLFHVQIHAS